MRRGGQSWAGSELASTALLPAPATAALGLPRRARWWFGFHPPRPFTSPAALAAGSIPPRPCIEPRLTFAPSPGSNREPPTATPCPLFNPFFLFPPKVPHLHCSFPRPSVPSATRQAAKHTAILCISSSLESSLVCWSRPSRVFLRAPRYTPHAGVPCNPLRPAAEARLASVYNIYRCPTLDHPL